MRIFEHLKTDWFRYGVETVAVIVVILSAFAIDNYDEKRKEIKREKLYLENIRAEFVDNKVTAERQLEYARIQRSNSELLINIAHKDSVPADTVKFLQALEYTGWTFPIVYANDEWSDLHSTGNLKIIRNHKLIQLLRKFYKLTEILEGLVPQFEGYKYAYREIYGEIMDPLLRLEIMQSLSGYSGYKKINYIPDIEKIISSLRQNERVGNSLVEIFMTQGSKIKFLENQLIIIEEILEILE